MENKEIAISLYDMNEQLIKQLDWPEDAFEVLSEALNDWPVNAEYWMLLCKEISYYTMVHYIVGGECGSLEQAILECVAFYGRIKTAYVSNNQMEIWVYDEKVDQMYCFHFFPADDFVVTVDKLGG